MNRVGLDNDNYLDVDYIVDENGKPLRSSIFIPSTKVFTGTFTPTVKNQYVSSPSIIVPKGINIMTMFGWSEWSSAGDATFCLMYVDGIERFRFVLMNRGNSVYNTLSNGITCIRSFEKDTEITVHLEEDFTSTAATVVWEFAYVNFQPK